MPTLDQIFGGPGTAPKKDDKPSLDQLFTAGQGGKGMAPAEPGSVAASMQTELGERDPNVDYSKGASFGTRLQLSRATPGTPQEENYLTSKYGAGNFRKDPGGRWLVKEDNAWVPVYPSGVMETMENVGAKAIVPGLTAAGAGAGAAVGGVPGAAIGGGGVAYLNEMLKEQQGFGPTTGTEKIEAALPEAAMSGAFQLGGSLMRGGVQSGKQVAGAVPEAVRKGLQWFGDVDPKTAPGVAARWADFTDQQGKAVRPPLISLGPGFQGAEWGRQLANKLRSDKAAGPRLDATLSRVRDTFERFGVAGPELDDVMKTLVDTKTRLDPSHVGEGLVKKLGTTQTELIGKANRELDTAAKILEKEYDATRSWATKESPGLTERVSRSFELAKKQFQQAMSQQYDRITQMTGDAPLVNMNDAAMQVQTLINRMPPEAVPPILRRMAQHGALGETGLPESVTFAEAHNLRSQLREMANSSGLEPLGLRRGNLAHLASTIDDALNGAGSQLGRGEMGQRAAAMLKQTDEIYKRDVQKFTNKVLNDIVNETRAGRPPNPSELVDLISGQKFEGGVKQVWNALPSELQNQVRTQYIDNLLEKATVNLGKGKRTVDPDALTNALSTDRGTHEAIIGSKWTSRLHEMADEYRAIGGKELDVTGLRPSEFRGALETALKSQQALKEFVESNPAQALQAGNPDAKAYAAKYFSSGSDARTAAALERFGVNSPEWKEVQKHALEDAFKAAVVPETKASGMKMSAGTLDEAFRQWSPFQQKALFGDKLPEIKALVNDVRNMFPELGSDMSAGLAAGGIKARLAEPATWKKYIARVGLGWYVDNPKLFDFIAGYRKQEPEAAAAFVQSQFKKRWLQALAQAGTETARGTAAPIPLPNMTREFAGTSGVKPKQESYGGPME